MRWQPLLSHHIKKMFYLFYLISHDRIHRIIETLIASGYFQQKQLLVNLLYQSFPKKK